MDLLVLAVYLAAALAGAAIGFCVLARLARGAQAEEASEGGSAPTDGVVDTTLSLVEEPLIEALPVPRSEIDASRRLIKLKPPPEAALRVVERVSAADGVSPAASSGALVLVKAAPKPVVTPAVLKPAISLKTSQPPLPLVKPPAPPSATSSAVSAGAASHSDGSDDALALVLLGLGFVGFVALCAAAAASKPRAATPPTPDPPPPDPWKRQW